MRTFLALCAAGAGLVLLTGCGGGSAEATDGTSVTSKAGTYVMDVSPRPEESPVNRLHVWDIELHDREGEPVSSASITVDGDMPEHGHGLPTQPRVRELGDGRYEVGGMKFQMGGRWYVRFSIAAAPGRNVVRVEFELPES